MSLRHRMGPRGWALAAASLLVVITLAVGGWFLASGGSTSASVAFEGTTVQGNGGMWTDISPDRLAALLEKKDFTLINVKTPYMGEIAGTDLYIPFDQLAARADELPRDRDARIVVYCRSGHQSALAAQSLIDLGYTSIESLQGGMAAWTDSGRALVVLPRS